jgi:hypothetical protein
MELARDLCSECSDPTPSVAVRAHCEEAFSHSTVATLRRHLKFIGRHEGRGGGVGLVKPTDCNVGQAARDRARRCRGELESHTGVIHAGTTRYFVLAVIPRLLSIKPGALTSHSRSPPRPVRSFEVPYLPGFCTYYVWQWTPSRAPERMRVAAWLPLRGRKRSRDAFVTQWAYYQ